MENILSLLHDYNLLLNIDLAERNHNYKNIFPEVDLLRNKKYILNKSVKDKNIDTYKVD